MKINIISYTLQEESKKFNKDKQLNYFFLNFAMLKLLIYLVQYDPSKINGNLSCSLEFIFLKHDIFFGATFVFCILPISHCRSVNMQ